VEISFTLWQKPEIKQKEREVNIILSGQNAMFREQETQVVHY